MAIRVLASRETAEALSEAAAEAEAEKAQKVPVPGPVSSSSLQRPRTTRQKLTSLTGNYIRDCFTDIMQSWDPSTEMQHVMHRAEMPSCQITGHKRMT